MARTLVVARTSCGGEAEEDEEEEEEQAGGNTKGQRSFARRKIRRPVFNGRMIPNLEAGGGISRLLSAEEQRTAIN